MNSIVTLLTTGGTVATTTTPDGRTAPTVDAASLASLVDLPGITVTARQLVRTPSWDLTPSAMTTIVLAARDVARETGQGVVITHGTTTLEYTAFLASLVVDVDVPVVLTGAMRRADHPAADGPANVAAAIRVAASTEARGRGPLVAFAGRVLSAGSVWKAERSELDAFVDLEGDVGRVDADAVHFLRRPRHGATFSGRLNDAVALVKAVPGADGRLIEAALAADAAGLVLEALPGAGGIPSPMHRALAAAAERVPVVVAARSPYGRMPSPPTGGTGEPLRELGLLSAGTLTAEQAWVLLMASLGDGTDARDARAMFRAAVQDRMVDKP